MKPLKVLYVHGGVLNRAGTENFMLNVLKCVEPQGVQIDFVVFGRTVGDLETEAVFAGSRIYRVPYRWRDLSLDGESWGHIIRSIKGANYDVVHAHMNALNGLVLALMKRLEIPVRISHCHSSGHLVKGFGSRLAMQVFKQLIPMVSTNCLACSCGSGDFLYGKHPYTVVPNGIDTALYGYDPFVRDCIRSDLGVSDSFVVGHVGRFSFEKNHDFIIDVFAKLKQQRSNAHLVLVGDGILIRSVQKKVLRLGLEKSVTFLGVVPSTAALLQAFDVLLLPSLYEGFPYALIEGQCSGLPCLVSDQINAEVALTDCVSFLKLDCDLWVDELLMRNVTTRKNYGGALAQLGYNSFTNAQRLLSQYQELVRVSANG